MVAITAQAAVETYNISTLNSYIRERAAERVKSILSTHYPEYIDPAVDAKIRDIFPILLPKEVMTPASGRW